MALLDWMSDVAGPVVRGDGVLLRPPRASDYAAWSALRDGSRDYLQPWEPAWPDDDLSKGAFRRRLSIYGREMELGNAWPFFVFVDGGKTLVGAVTLSNVRRGVAETGTLGYWIGAPFARQGYMREAILAVVHHAFAMMDLSRIEAACLPENTPSRGVLEKCGFKYEGVAQSYLQINGRWRNHVLYANLRNDRRGRTDVG